jgi:hypothetical protein
MSKLYVKGHDGHFIRSIDLSCADESAAIESAKQLVDAPGSSRGPPVVGDPVSAVTEAEILPSEGRGQGSNPFGRAGDFN